MALLNELRDTILVIRLKVLYSYPNGNSACGQ